MTAGLLRSRVWIALQQPSPSHAGGGEQWEACSGPHVRDTLDLAVRALAVGPGLLGDRVRAAGSILSGGLSRTDFLDEEDLAMFDRILLGLLELDLLGKEAGGTAAAEVQRVLASDIVDLRRAGRTRAARAAGERRAPRSAAGLSATCGARGRPGGTVPGPAAARWSPAPRCSCRANAAVGSRRRVAYTAARPSMPHGASSQPGRLRRSRSARARQNACASLDSQESCSQDWYS